MTKSPSWQGSSLKIEKGNFHFGRRPGLKASSLIIRMREGTTMKAVLLWIFSASIVFGQQAEILEVENIVQSAKSRRDWSVAQVGEKLTVRDRIRTRRKSRAMVKVSDLYTMRMDQYTTVEITPRLTGVSKPTLNVAKGITFIFSREQEGEIEVTTPTANAALRGTQLVVEVGDDGKTSVAVLEGEVDLSNEFGDLVLKAGESGEAERGKAPERTAVIKSKNLVQWALYYPGILDGSRMEFEGVLKRSLAAYREGDLMTALALLPEQVGRLREERLYHAQVLLVVGRVDESEEILKTIPEEDLRGQALRRLIQAVTFSPAAVDNNGIAVEFKSTFELTQQRGLGEMALAESYYLQANHDLKSAQEQAKEATRLSPENGFAWARLAELEFSFGNRKAAKSALQYSLQLTPRNAQAYALQGFILAGENKLVAAGQAFESALTIDGALGNAWLGRGLIKIRSGDLLGGREDLQTAATVEPTRAIFHSYLGKAFGEDRQARLANKDWVLAQELDPLDPTPWLYSAIENQKGNRLNRAVKNLEESVRLNDNRRVYRSQLLLDQDRAVRGSNLASIFQNLGLSDVALREATKAVDADYTNSSSHLFLSNVFDELRDPRRVSLRYETAWANELLLANLFAPVGGGPLSQFVSRQEYSKLFHSDGVGASLLGEWRSDDEIFATASLFGVEKNLEFGIDVNYRNTSGTRRNNDSQLAEVFAQVKWEPNPNDKFYLLGTWVELSAGDSFQTFDNEPLEPFVDFEESQTPGSLLLGWNHRWKPGVHTLALAGRLASNARISNPVANQLLVARDSSGLRPSFLSPDQSGFLNFTDPRLREEVPRPGSLAGDGSSLVLSPLLIESISPFLNSGEVIGFGGVPFDFFSEQSFEFWTSEIQQVFQTEKNTLLLGGRLQTGEIESTAILTTETPNGIGGFATPASQQSISFDFNRYSAYAYDYWKPLADLTLIGGVTWDYLEHPDNFRNPPFADTTSVQEEISGKAGFIYRLEDWLTLRGAYSQSLGGVTFDESVRLEPVQLAGFNQSFRTVISESLVGSVEAPKFTTWGLSLEGKLPTQTWWGLTVEGISQDVSREIGVFTGFDEPSIFASSPAFFPDTLRQELEYDEISFTATLNQLLGEELVLGARYQLTHSRLSQSIPDLAEVSEFGNLSDEATLHNLSLNMNWNSPSGFYANLEGQFVWQSLRDDSAFGASREGDEFVQVDSTLGYRFRDNQADISLSVLNLLGTDYQLSPLTPHEDFPRERTFLLRCRWNF